MTGAIVIIARTYPEAQEAARNLGLKSWIWPNRPEVLHGVSVGLVVYVEGWTESTAISTRALTVLAERMEPEAVTVDQPLSSTYLSGEQRAEYAQIILDHGRLDRRRPAQPFVAPEAWATGAVPTRRTWWQRVMDWLRA